MDKQLKSLLVKLGVIQAIATAVFGAAMWFFTVGRASADYVRKDDLSEMKQDIKTLRNDVAYIRGRMDN